MSFLISIGMQNSYKDALKRLRSPVPLGNPIVSRIFSLDWSYCALEQTQVKKISAHSPKTELPASEKIKQLDKEHDFSLKRVSKTLTDLSDSSSNEKNSSFFFEKAAACACFTANLEGASKEAFENYRSKQLQGRSNRVKVYFIVGESEGLEGKDADTRLLEYFFSSECADLFERMLGAMKLSPRDYIIAALQVNLDKKILSCHYDLLEDIKAYAPEVVVTLGGDALGSVLGDHLKLQSSHGKFFKREVTLSSNVKHEFEVIPLFSPVFLHEAPNTKKIAWEDMQKVMKRLGL